MFVSIREGFQIGLYCVCLPLPALSSDVAKSFSDHAPFTLVSVNRTLLSQAVLEDLSASSASRRALRLVPTVWLAV